MVLKKLLDVVKPIFAIEIKTEAGKINLAFGGLLIILDIALSINLEIGDSFFWGVRDFPTKGLTICIIIYIFLCIGYLFVRDFKKKK